MKLTINTKALPDVPVEHLKEMLGVLPYWVREYNLLGKGMGDVQSDGTYSDPEDPDLPYIGKMNTPNGYVYFYQYAMLALPLPNGEYFVTRMD